MSNGARLGVIAPGTALTLEPKLVDAAYRALGARGFRTLEASQCRARVGHTAGSPEERAAAVQQFFADPNIDGIMAFWGGFQSHQILDHLDFDEIRTCPKVLIGYSDVTALSIGIYSQTGLVTFSGPAAITFAKPTLPEYTWESLHSTLISAHPRRRVICSAEFADNEWYTDSQGMMFEPTPPWRTFRSGYVSGRCIAGHLGTMLLLAGTRYWPNLDGAILIVEASEEETPATLDRMFVQLRQMGVYDQIGGLVVGRIPRSVGFTNDDSLDAILVYALRGYDFPVLLDVDYGHTDPIMTIPIGVDVQLDADAHTLFFPQAAVTSL